MAKIQESSSRVDKLLSSCSKWELKHFEAYLLCPWNIGGKYGWIEPLLQAKCPNSEIETLHPNQETAPSPPKAIKTANGRLAAKFREYLAIKHLEGNLPMINLLYVLEMSKRISTNTKSQDPELLADFLSFAKSNTNQWLEEGRYWHVYQSTTAMASAQTDGKPRGIDMRCEANDAIRALDQYYLRERLKAECIRISNEAIMGPKRDYLDESQSHSPLHMFADAMRSISDTATEGYLRMLEVLNSEESTRKRSLEELVDFLKNQRISKEDKSTLLGLIHNLALRKIKDGWEDGDHLLWNIYQMAVSEKLMTTKAGTMPMALARNLLKYGFITNNGKKAFSLLKRHITEFGFRKGEKADFLAYAEAFKAYYNGWKVPGKLQNAPFQSLDHICFQDHFLQLAVWDLSFKIAFHLNINTTSPETILNKIKGLIDKSAIVSGPNLESILRKHQFYKDLVEARLNTEQKIDHFIIAVNLAKLDPFDTEWMIAMGQ